MNQQAGAPSQPLHKTAQRLRWFVDAFQEQVNRTSRETGNVFALDEASIGQVFAEWLKSFNAQKPADSRDNPAYVGFAAGLMLRTLVRLNPVHLVSRPEHADDSNPAYFWPEGYLYVAFCLNVRGLVLATDFDREQRPGDQLYDTRNWWSFKENVTEDPQLAIAFLDFFAGDEPEWVMPELFRTGRMRAVAHRFFDRSDVDALG